MMFQAGHISNPNFDKVINETESMKLVTETVYQPPMISRFEAQHHMMKVFLEGLEHHVAGPHTCTVAKRWPRS